MMIIALIATRHEAEYLQRCLAYIREQHIKAYVIDNGSDEETNRLLQYEFSDILVGFEKMPWPGFFDHEGLLKRKHALRLELKADWYIHWDVDEILQSDRIGETLYEALTRVDAQGYNVVNFNEFVFIPETESVDYTGLDYLQRMKHYYFFQPGLKRLMRAFSNQLAGDNISTGGHRFTASAINLHPGSFSLRHYIALSMERFYQKYNTRVFNKKEVQRGWHGNRLILQQSRPPHPGKENLLTARQGMPLSVEKPFSQHFWQWEPGE